MSYFYFTDNLIFDYNDKSYYLFENNEKIKISNKNWISFLEIYGWEELDWQLENILDSKFRVLECGAGGDCFFHSLSEALNINNIYSNIEILYDTQIIREYAAQMVNKTNYEFILNNYIIEINSGEFQGDWKPENISSIEDLKTEIKKCGDSFWADNIIISLLSDYFKINFIIISLDLLDNYSIIQLSKKYKQNIIFLYESGCHYKLVGRFDGKKINTIFNNIPKILKQYIL